jgi:PrtD family type I secretion system ABC transporter
MSWLFVKRLRSFVFLAAFASLVFNVTLLMPAVYMMQVFDRVLVSGSGETLVMLGAVTLLFLALGFFLDTVRARALAWAGRSVERKLAPLAVRSSIEQAATGPGRVDTDVLRDVAQLRAFLSGHGILALFDAPWLSIYLLLIALMHPMLGLTATIGALVLIALGVLTDWLSRGHAEDVVRGSRSSARLAERLARNAEVILGMGMTGTAVSKWCEQREELLGTQQRQARTSSALASLARMLRQVLQVVMLAVGAWLVIDMQASAGIMVAATVLLSRALQPVEHLIGGWRTMVEARGAWRRLGERSAIGVDAPVRDGATHGKWRVVLPAPSGRIDVERLAYAFSSSRPPLIRNLSFSLPAGESLGVIGASASGKTTLARLLLGLWRPQSGVVRLDSADISRWDRDALGEHIGYLPQDVELFAGTVGENIARLRTSSGAEASERIVHAAQLAHAHEMILQLPDGYDTQIGDGGAVLSGGQRQRIALARALYGSPRFVVLDEPDANLDLAGQAALLEALSELKARGTTVVVVSHNPTITATLDKLLVLKDGTLDMFGPSAAVMARLRIPSQPNRVLPFGPAAEVRRAVSQAGVSEVVA